MVYCCRVLADSALAYAAMMLCNLPAFGVAVNRRGAGDRDQDRPRVVDGDLERRSDRRTEGDRLRDGRRTGSSVMRLIERVGVGVRCRDLDLLLSKYVIFFCSGPGIF